jgi:fatty-acyl-CoA synthase
MPARAFALHNRCRSAFNLESAANTSWWRASMTTEATQAGAVIEPRDNLSYVRGASDIPLSDATVSRHLLDTVTRFPDRAAVVFREQGIRWSWRAFADEVDVLATALLALGIQPGDRVGIWSPNRAEWLLTQFATARMGAVLVNINPAYRLAELEYALNKVGCRAIVAAEAFKSSKYLEMLQTLAPELADAEPNALHAAKLPDLRAVIRMGAEQSPGMLNFDALMDAHRAHLDRTKLDALEATLAADEPINIQFTSGTTGNPKGATLTHRNIVNNARYIAMAMRLSEQDSLCIPVPLYHCFGMVLAVLACVSTGCAMVFPGEAFDPGATLAAVHEERCTALHGVPTMFIAELEHPDFDKFDLSRLRTGIMAGSPCPIETMKRVVSKMHLAEITIAYGMTETSPVSFQSSTTDPLDKRTTTVGRIQPHLEVKIIDALGRMVPVGETGELCTRGYSVMRGYWGDEAKTREAIVDGWMHTGDLATLDAEGYCNIVGRLKDMLIRGGENIYPREIEEFLFRHPKIQSVQVFGVPDQKYGEEVCAWIVTRPGEQLGEDDVREFCQGQIAHYKIPRYVRFVDELPMTVTGKVQKFVMRARMIDELKLVEGRTA